MNVARIRFANFYEGMFLEQFPRLTLLAFHLITIIVRNVMGKRVLFILI